MSTRPVRVSSLAELKLVKREIEAQAVQRKQALAEDERLKRESAMDSNLFLQAAGAVRPLPDGNRTHLKKAVAAMPVMQYQRDEQAVLKEAISDDFDSSTLLDSDDELSFRRPGIGVDITRKLRRGEWSIQGQIDLHGLRRDEAREHLSFFIREAHKHGLRCVRVVHGKGLGSPGKAPILKSRVQSWLVQKNEVLAFVQAKPAEGGAGALLVLLAPVRS